MSGIYSELKRRNVFRVAIGYVLVAWVLLQIADVLFPALRLPDWTVSLVAGLMILGFPLALLFAWAYELTPEGLKRESEVDPDKSITHMTGRRLDFIVIAVLAVAVLLFAFDKFARDDAPAAVVEESQSKAIAVLPFINMSDDPANEYFSDGMSEELLNLLAQIPELRVIGRTSSFQFRDEHVDLREIGRILGVTEILEGSVRKSGDKVRITAQLVSANDGAHLWSGRYDRKLDDVFRVQDDIAKAVVNALRLQLLGGLPEREAPASTAAYELYLQGLFAYRRFGASDLETAKRFFDQALALDPTLAAAWYWTGSVLINQTLGGVLPLDEGIVQARIALDRAIELEPNSAEANYARGFMKMVFERDWQGAQASMQRALAIEPNHSAALSGLGLLRLALGDADEAEALLTKSVAADPLRVGSRHNLGFVLYNAGQSQQAVDVLRNAFEYSPDLPRSRFRIALALLANGQAEEALAEAEMEPGEQWRIAGLAIVLHEVGRQDEANAALADLTARFDDEVSYVIAAAHAVHGNTDAALEWIDRAYERNDPLLPWAGWDPMMTNLHDDPGFTAVLERLNLPNPRARQDESPSQP